jgi:hypothetical protein
MVYALLDLGREKVVAAYLGHADHVAFNRSVLERSLAGLEALPLLVSEVAGPIAVSWEPAAPGPAPDAPVVPLPAGWSREPTAPRACRGLPAPDGAVSSSPSGDFTVALRAAWWRAGSLAVDQAAGACAGRAASAAGRYSFRRNVFGAAYLHEGAFVRTADGGLLRLEVQAPTGKLAFVRPLLESWIGRSAPRPRAAMP